MYDIIVLIYPLLHYTPHVYHVWYLMYLAVWYDIICFHFCNSIYPSFGTSCVHFQLHILPAFKLFIFSLGAGTPSMRCRKSWMRSQGLCELGTVWVTVIYSDQWWLYMALWWFIVILSYMVGWLINICVYIYIYCIYYIEIMIYGNLWWFVVIACAFFFIGTTPLSLSYMDSHRFLVI